MKQSYVHPSCGRKITGTKSEHCPSCCQTFGTTRAGDKHRKGNPAARYCVDPASVGLITDRFGVWRTPMTGTDRERVGIPALHRSANFA
jgi:hypothetical protein